MWPNNSATLDSSIIRYKSCSKLLLYLPTDQKVLSIFPAKFLMNDDQSLITPIRERTNVKAYEETSNVNTGDSESIYVRSRNESKDKTCISVPSLNVFCVARYYISQMLMLIIQIRMFRRKKSWKLCGLLVNQKALREQNTGPLASRSCKWLRQRVTARTNLTNRILELGPMAKAQSPFSFRVC